MYTRDVIILCMAMFAGLYLDNGIRGKKVASYTALYNFCAPLVLYRRCIFHEKELLGAVLQYP